MSCNKAGAVLIEYILNTCDLGGIMLLKRRVYRYLAIVLLVLIGTTGIAFSAAPDTIETVAGITAVVPTGIATDAYGNIYIADAGSHKVTMATAAGITLLSVGTGTAGFVPTSSGATGLNTTLADTTIQLNAPSGVAVDVNGNVYIADTGNHRIHMIFADTTTKIISTASKIITIAGSGMAGFSGDGMLANSASLNHPTAVTVDATGIVYIADNGNNRIRKVLAAKVSTTGVITYGTISTLAGDGRATTLTAYGVSISPAPAGDLYIADSGNNRILKLIAAKGLPITVAGNGVAGFSGDGGLAVLAQLSQPSGVATDGKDLYIADTMNICIRKVSLATGIISTRVGSTAQAASVIPAAPVPALSFPMGVNVNGAGTLYVADTGNAGIDQIFASVSAITTASPPGGTYATTQFVTLTASQPASISYSLNGGPAIQYTGPFTVSGPATSVLTFSSLDFAGHQEVTNIATYNFDTTAPTTSAVINATSVNGIYYSAKSTLTVMLASNSNPSTIYYTTAGTAPTVTSPKYSVPFSIGVTSALTTTNVQFFAVDTAGNQEVVQSQKYSTVALNTTASPAGGAYRSAQIVTLAANDSSAPIYYTTDGTVPTTSSSLFNPLTHITIAASTVLKFRALDADGILEQTKSQIYTIDSVAPTTTISPSGNSYATPQIVTLTPDDFNATIYFTTNGIAPTTTSTRYSSPITINATTTLMYFAMDPAGNKEAVKTEIYTIDAIAPITTASIPGGTYASIQPVTLTSTDPNATIYFTTDGTVPTTASAVYTLPILISKTAKLSYFAVDVAGNKESIKEQNYTIIPLTTTASPKGGIFTKLQTVTLAANGVGTTIFFTVDGSQPAVTISKQYPTLTVSFTDPTQEYTVPIVISSATTLRFFAIDEKGVIENVRSETYAIDSEAPSTTATCNPLSNSIKLIATDATDPMPQIKYSANTATNGGVIAAYTLADYTGPITYTKNTLVKFFATDAAGNTEPIKTAYCPVVVAPLDTKPAVYLETLPAAASTSNDSLYIQGTIAPFSTTILDINGVIVPTSTVDGSFSHLITTPVLIAGANAITTTATNGLFSTADSRTINYVSPGTTPTSVSIGASNAVIGHEVRIPITFTSGHQAAAVSIDIAYDPSTSRLSNPRVKIAKAAAALGKTIQGGSPVAGIYRILIMDNPASSSIVPLPDGEIAYLEFSIPFTVSAGNEPLVVSSFSATDLQTNPMVVLPAADGKANVVSKTGNNIGSTIGDTAVTLKGVQDALNMLLDPVTHPVDGAADLNADGLVQIYELQQVINSFIGL